MATSAARDTSLKLLPDLAKQVKPRADRLNLTVSNYVAVLIWNQHVAPVALSGVKDSARTVRVNVPCYFRRAIAPLLRRVASDADLSANAAAEALIERDLRKPDAPLTILPRR